MTTPNSSKGMEKLDHCSIYDGKVKWDYHFGKVWQFFRNAQHTIAKKQT